CLMQTFVKLMLRLTTYVTLSPTVFLRSSSATVTTRFISSPLQSNSATASSAEMSLPSSALSRSDATAGSAFFRRESIIDVTLLYQPGIIGYQACILFQPIRCNKSTFEEFRVYR